MDGKVFGAGRPLAALFMVFVVSAAMFGCDGADQTTGTQATPDAAAAKQQQDQQQQMKDFYAKNPLKIKKTRP